MRLILLASVGLLAGLPIPAQTAHKAASASGCRVLATTYEGWKEAEELVKSLGEAGDCSTARGTADSG